MAVPPPPSPAAPQEAPPTHSRLEDAQAVATCVVLVSLGLSLLNTAGLMTGGTPGLGFLLSYATGWPLGLALFLVNIPFYVLAWSGMGWRFTLKTLGAVTALSIGVEVVHRMLSVRTVDPLYAALAGGTLIGLGLLVLFRHGASLGGVNTLALFLNKRFAWSVGTVQMVIDVAILASAFAVMEPTRVAWSLLGALAVNAVLISNHRPGRYLPASR
jgi:uncharacterized membrane-anchored protein YitT (DUF2179 family)